MPRFGAISAKPSQIRYAEGKAPFGELDLLRPTRHNYIETNPTLEIAAGYVLAKAWLDSNWLRAKLPETAITQFAEESWQAPAVEQARKAAMRSFLDPVRQATWFAVRPTKRNRRDNPGKYVISREVVGYAHVKRDVSGSPLARAIKSGFVHDKVYASISDVNVTERGKHIGTALFHAALVSVVDREQPVTTHVLGEDAPLVDALAEIGFRKTDEHSRTNLVEGYRFTESRLLADSVGAVQSALEERYPWLRDGERLA